MQIQMLSITFFLHNSCKIQLNSISCNFIDALLVLSVVDGAETMFAGVAYSANAWLMVSGLR